MSFSFGFPSLIENVNATTLSGRMMLRMFGAGAIRTAHGSGTHADEPFRSARERGRVGGTKAKEKTMNVPKFSATVKLSSL
jgi:hypothetical protein